MVGLFRIGILAGFPVLFSHHIFFVAEGIVVLRFFIVIRRTWHMENSFPKDTSVVSVVRERSIRLGVLKFLQEGFWIKISP